MRLTSCNYDTAAFEALESRATPDFAVHVANVHQYAQVKATRREEIRARERQRDRDGD